MKQVATLFVNGNILTMDPAVPRVDSLLTRDGRVAALGPRDAIEAATSPGTRRVDLLGRTVVPGFNDCHCHILNFGLTLDQVDVGADSSRSIADIQRALAQQAEQTPAAEWIIGRGYDQNVLAENRHPTRDDLDALPGGHPVVLWHTSGHALTCNSRALEAAGVSETSEVPSGGEIDRDEHGRPTGVLKETATDLVSRVIPSPSVEQGAEAIIRAMDVMASQGITSATDAATGEGGSAAQQIQMYRRALQSGRLTGRITLMPQIRYVASPDDDGVRSREDFSLGSQPEWLRLGATKIFSDGALTTRTAALREPYADTGSAGLLLWDPDVLRDMIQRAHNAGWQIATHAIGDRAIDVVLDCYSRALDESPRQDHRHRIEHCMLVDRDQIGRIQQLGVVPVMQPGFISRLGDAYVAGLGEERAGDLMPLQWFDWSGVTVGFSSDRPVIPGAPLRGIRAALQRTAPSGTVLGAQHRITAMEAIRYYTAGSAYASHADGDVGSLRRGSLADFTVLSHNPADLSADEFSRLRVDMTVVGGTETFGE